MPLVHPALRVLVLLVAVPIRAPAAETAPPAPPATLPALRERLAAHVGAPRFAGASWGVSIVSLDSGRVWFEHDARRPLSPASNTKLFTGALALDALGAAYRIRTPILADRPPDATGVVRGAIYVSGRGDPSWRARGGPGAFADAFAPVGRALQSAGVARVDGDLIADATWFHEAPAGAGWTADDLNDGYGAEISALSLAQNFAELRLAPAAAPGGPVRAAWLQPEAGLELVHQVVTGAPDSPGELVWRRLPGETRVHVWGSLPAGGSTRTLAMTVPFPARWYAAALKAALTQSGIPVSGAPRAVRWPDPSPVPADAIALGEIVSPPLRELVAAFMKPSQNLETDLIFGHVGELRRRAETPPHRTGAELALGALREFLERLGVPPDEVWFEEGSGLSRNNLVTAHAVTALLVAMARHGSAEDFRASLPIAGAEGTLRARLRGTAAEGNVRAKTGTLRYANALSGYVTTAGGERLAFSLILNRQTRQPPGRSVRLELDEIAALLAAFPGRG